MHKVFFVIVLLIPAVLLGEVKDVAKSTQTIQGQGPIYLSSTDPIVKEYGEIKGKFSKFAEKKVDAWASVGADWSTTTIRFLILVRDQDIKFNKKISKSDGVWLYLPGRTIFLNDKAYNLKGRKSKIAENIEMQINIQKKAKFIFKEGGYAISARIPWTELDIFPKAGEKILFNTGLQDIDKKNRGKIIWLNRKAKGYLRLAEDNRIFWSIEK